MGTGLVVVAVSIGLAAGMLYFDFESIAGFGFMFIGWIIAGLGAAEVIFGQRLKWLRWTLGAVLGLAGFVSSWAVLEQVFGVSLGS